MAKISRSDDEIDFPNWGGVRWPRAKLPLAPLIGVALVALVIAIAGYVWMVQRVEVEAGNVLVLIHKVGDSLPDAAEDQIVLYPALLELLGEPANSRRFKGIVYDVLPEGRYFFDPFFWERRTVPAVVLASGENPNDSNVEIGVLVRKYGKPLPAGKVVATEPHERGPLAEVLAPGRYNINPYAYEVKRIKPVFIPEGFVGVQTLYSGDDPKNPNDFVVEPGERGVQPDALPPGMYYNNPYVRRIDLMETRTQSLSLDGDHAIRFPSNDSFQIEVEATVQYAIRQDKAPYVLTAIGDHQDIAEKLILPYANSLSRIEGSKLLARDFISGERRREWQERVFQDLSEQCYSQGIDIQQVLIRRINPPPRIAGPISERQLAEQEVNRFNKEIDLARSQASYVEQEELRGQNQALGEANREVVTVTKEASQRRAVALTEANQRLEVAKLKLQAARETAQALLALGQAEAEVALLRYEAEARPLQEAVLAFGDGEAYAQFFFYQKLGPALKSILASTDGPFAEIFRSLSAANRAGPSVPKPAAARVPAPSAAREAESAFPAAPDAALKGAQQ